MKFIDEIHEASESDEELRYIEFKCEYGIASGISIEYTSDDDAIYLADRVSMDYLSCTAAIVDNLSLNDEKLVYLDRLRSHTENKGHGTYILSEFEKHSSYDRESVIVYGHIPDDKPERQRKEIFSPYNFLKRFYSSRGYEFIDENNFYKEM